MVRIDVLLSAPTATLGGVSALAQKQNLVITGGSGNIIATLYNMTLPKASHNYPKFGDRVERLEFVSNTRGITTGAATALFTVALVA